MDSARAGDTRERLRRSINALERIHAVIIGFALTAGARTFMEPWLANSGDKSDAPFPWTALFLFGALCFTLVPFFHGATRHLDCMHLYGKGPPSRTALLLDYGFLFAEGVVFLAIGLSVRSVPHFIRATLLLLGTDTLWGLVTLGLSPRGETLHVKRWLWLNLITALPLLGALLFVTGDVSMPLLVGAIVRTAIDYWRNWKFYFDVTTP